MMSFASVVAIIIGYVNGIIWVLGSLAVVFFMVGIVQYIYRPTDKHRRTNMLWSLITLFVLFSVWGILRLTCNTFLQNGCGDGGPMNINAPINEWNNPPSSTGTSGGTGGGFGGLY